MAVRLPRLVVASANPGKLRELGALLAGFATEVVPQAALGIASADETETTFEGNALLKARHAALLAGAAALADDSGLEVEALDGRPGVYSARFAGAGASDEDNNRLLLESLSGVPEPRRACYRCVIALVRAADDPAPLIAHGRWDGRIGLAPRGTGGFGYDPLFLAGAGEETVAEMPAAIKNRISHRALALAALRAQLERA